MRRRHFSLRRLARAAAPLPARAWLALRIAAVVALVVIPFGYAITGLHADVAMGAGCGVAIGLGIGLRGGQWTGVLIGATVGIAVALLAGLVPGNPYGVLVPPALALAVGLIVGFHGPAVAGYRDVTRETAIVAGLLAAGLLPGWVLAAPESGFLKSGTEVLVTLLLIPWISLMAGLLSHRRQGWRDTRPSYVLVAAAMVAPGLLILGLASGSFTDTRGLSGLSLLVAVVSTLGVTLVAIPALAFVLGRSAVDWLEPRLRVYGSLADYLKVLWVPIGAFALGYLTIIVVFAGFYGVLERFQPGAFADAGSGIVEWLSFAFFTALGQDYATTAPVSLGARVLVGIHLLLGAGWAVVLFAAVMTSIGPRLERIARRQADEDGD